MNLREQYAAEMKRNVRMMHDSEKWYDANYVTWLEDKVEALRATARQVDAFSETMRVMLAALQWAATVIRPGSDLRNDMDAAIKEAQERLCAKHAEASEAKGGG
jgi:hypothetical protein